MRTGRGEGQPGPQGELGHLRTVLAQRGGRGGVHHGRSPPFQVARETQCVRCPRLQQVHLGERQRHVPEGERIEDLDRVFRGQ